MRDHTNVHAKPCLAALLTHMQALTQCFLLSRSLCKNTHLDTYYLAPIISLQKHSPGYLSSSLCVPNQALDFSLNCHQVLGKEHGSCKAGRAVHFHTHTVLPAYGKYGQTQVLAANSSFMPKTSFIWTCSPCICCLSYYLCQFATCQS